jgi:hypothetical protein
MVFRRSDELDASMRAAAQPSADPLEAAQRVLWIALTIRKLSESGELPILLMRQVWPSRFHWLRPHARATRGDLAQAYELSRWRHDEVPTLRLCGLLIHCYVLEPTDDGIYFTSHLEKDQGLFFLEWAVIGRMVDAVCANRPRSGVIRVA